MAPARGETQIFDLRCAWCSAALGLLLLVLSWFYMHNGAVSIAGIAAFFVAGYFAKHRLPSAAQLNQLAQRHRPQQQLAPQRPPQQPLPRPVVVDYDAWLRGSAQRLGEFRRRQQQPPGNSRTWTKT